jgi:hypothetical protein
VFRASLWRGARHIPTQMFEFMDSMNQELLVGKEMRADKTKWWSPHDARC